VEGFQGADVLGYGKRVQEEERGGVMYKVKIYSLAEIVEVETLTEAYKIIEREQSENRNICIVEDGKPADESNVQFVAKKPVIKYVEIKDGEELNWEDIIE
jgi:hypothetical protein